MANVEDDQDLDTGRRNPYRLRLCAVQEGLARDSVSTVKRQVFDGLPVEGFKRGGCVTIHISGSNSLTNSKNPIKVAELADGCAPRVRVMAPFGVNDQAWGMVRVDTDGNVYLTHMYGQDETVWTTVDTSVTFAA